jgi:hypothetical protein
MLSQLGYALSRELALKRHILTPYHYKEEIRFEMDDTNLTHINSEVALVGLLVRARMLLMIFSQHR